MKSSYRLVGTNIFSIALIDQMITLRLSFHAPKSFPLEGSTPKVQQKHITHSQVWASKRFHSHVSQSHRLHFHIQSLLLQPVFRNGPETPSVVNYSNEVIHKNPGKWPATLTRLHPQESVDTFRGTFRNPDTGKHSIGVLWLKQSTVIILPSTEDVIMKEPQR